MGRKSTPRKARAVRVNGMLGGRPVPLGIMRRKEDPEELHVEVAWSRSYGGLVFTRPGGAREFWAAGACARPEDGLRLMSCWFCEAQARWLWFPYYNVMHRWDSRETK